MNVNQTTHVRMAGRVMMNQLDTIATVFLALLVVTARQVRLYNMHYNKYVNSNLFNLAAKLQQ